MIHEQTDHLEPYIEALGEETAERLFLQLGGSQVYLPDTRSTRNSRLASLLGTEKAVALGTTLGYGYIKVPLASAWIARQMTKRGISDNEIARTVRSDVSTVRRWLTA